MKLRVLIFAAAALSGLACGAVWPRAADLRFAEGRIRLGERATRGNAETGLVGASSPRDEALGTALRTLLAEKSDLRGLADLGVALEQLDARGIGKLLEQIEIDPSRPMNDRLAWLFRWWMKRDPAAASAWIRPRLDALKQDGPAGSNFEMRGRGRLIVAWADADPEAALTYARSHSRSGLATVLLRQAWAPRDRSKARGLLLDFPAGRARDVALEEFHKSWAYKDPAAAFASACALAPGTARDKALPAVLLAWAEKDASAAFAQYRALGLNDPVLLSRVLAKNAAKNPAETLGWLQQLDPAQVAPCAPKVVQSWAERDPVAALDWALANGIRLSPTSSVTLHTQHAGFARSGTMSSESVSPLGHALEKQPEATLAWLRALPAGAERDRVSELALTVSRDRKQALSLFAALSLDAAARAAGYVASQFREEPERGLEWAMALPAGPVRFAGLASIATYTGQQMPELPPGPDRDAFLSGTINGLGGVPPPAEKLERVLQIGDPVLRRDMFEAVFERYREMPHLADETRAALEQAAVPEEWKRRWRETLGSTP